MGAVTHAAVGAGHRPGSWERIRPPVSSAGGALMTKQALGVGCDEGVKAVWIGRRIELLTHAPEFDHPDRDTLGQGVDRDQGGRPWPGVGDLKAEVTPAVLERHL